MKMTQVQAILNRVVKMEKPKLYTSYNYDLNIVDEDRDNFSCFVIDKSTGAMKEVTINKTNPKHVQYVFNDAKSLAMLVINDPEDQMEYSVDKDQMSLSL